jgi:hypothetical protein
MLRCDGPITEIVHFFYDRRGTSEGVGSVLVAVLSSGACRLCPLIPGGTLISNGRLGCSDSALHNLVIPASRFSSPWSSPGRYADPCEPPGSLMLPAVLLARRSANRQSEASQSMGVDRHPDPPDTCHIWHLMNGFGLLQKMTASGPSSCSTLFRTQGCRRLLQLESLGWRS